MNKRIIVSLVILFIGLLAGCANVKTNYAEAEGKEKNHKDEIAEYESAINELQNDNKVLQEKVTSQQLDLRYSKEESEYYKEIIKKLTSKLSNKELAELAKSQWIYELKVNNEAIPANGEIIVEQNEVVVSLSQSQSPYPVLPIEFFEKGKISGEYKEHLTNINPQSSDISMTDGTISTGTQWKFRGIKSNSKITFSITEELKERLGMSTTQITITKK